jgi:hypothetical protein
MTWWKFWTWYRRDEPHGSFKTRGDLSETGVDIHDDILISISGLIDNQQDDVVEFIRTTRTAELSTVAESDSNVQAIAGVKTTETVAGTETTDGSGIAEQNEIRQASAPIEAKPRFPSEVPVITSVRIPERRPASTIDPPRPPMNVREPGTLNREAARKDPRKTLVAEDGQWPTLKGLSGSFSDLDDADDDSDDFDGPSPFQTIVPNDD